MSWGPTQLRLLQNKLGLTDPGELPAWWEQVVHGDPAQRAQALERLRDYLDSLQRLWADDERAARQAGEALAAEQARRERLELALDSADAAVWDWAITEGRAYFSPRVLAILGYAPGEIDLTLALWREHMQPDDRIEARERLQAHLRGEAPHYEAEFRVRTKSGQWRWIRSRGRAVAQDAEGRPLRVVGTHTDVTDRRVAEEEVLHQLRFIEELVEIIPNPVYFKDRLGRYIGCNRACEMLFGLRREDWLGRTATDLRQDDAGREEERYDEALYAEGGIQTYETRLPLPTGEVRDVIFSKTLFTGTQGGIGGVLGVITDITQQKRVESELRDAKTAAEAASRAKSEFLANMSHEIRTPMNGIMGLVDLTLETQLSDSQRRYLTLVRSSSTSLLNIINDILDLSRIEAGRMNVEQLAFDLRTLLQEAVAPLEPRAREKGLALHSLVAPDVPEQLVADPLRLRQILVNLVGNAIKFTRQGRVDVSAWPEGQGGAAMLHVCVADTGVGIPADKLERIFESFTQADSSTTREFGGTGLGLTISRRLAEAMGGRLWAESEAGQGSRFHLTLPLLGVQADDLDHELRRDWGVAAAPSLNLSRDKARTRFETTAYRGLDELESVDASDDGESGLHVLLVDDHAVNRFIATSLIRRLGHRVTCAVTATEALALCEAQDFDLIFMDIQIPGMNGIELTHRIRAMEAARGWHCPIVALTAHAMPLDRVRCLEAGMDDYLTKPVEQDRLQGVLQLVSRARR
ncbi:hybrid sensor histidine kinase/response regulator [Caldimonas brevitalea]|uniref:histidine kinase n=1 Tax=Caldimonas brevitalea TaxID=413882 RepID=A0A0G3BFC6_9BURK|nr:PAS domain-containing hybrid sensor histidine kinase/response regulator [Caldimonas brevitalea]AKJ28022.1 diguanylate cyclase/phosphodiesterase [Caldimonas brevitalea]